MTLSPFAQLNARFGDPWTAIENAVAVADMQRLALRGLIRGNGTGILLARN